MKDTNSSDVVPPANGNRDPVRQPSDAVSELARRALARLCAETGVSPASSKPVRAQEVISDPLPTAIAYALCDAEPDTAQGLVDDLLDAGVTVEDVCLDHLAPAARRLGEWWMEDRVPFTDVTLATARIQSMMLRLPASTIAPVCTHDRGALFAAVPGEQHTLGVMMAADLFRRNGWDVGLLIGADHNELVARMSRDDRPVIGLSCSGDHSYPALRRLMSAIRRSRPNAHLLLSGQIVGHADRLADLSVPFTPVKDTEDAERVMLRLGRDLSAANGSARPNRRSGS